MWVWGVGVLLGVGCTFGGLLGVGCTFGVVFGVVFGMYFGVVTSAFPLGLCWLFAGTARFGCCGGLI